MTPNMKIALRQQLETRAAARKILARYKSAGDEERSYLRPHIRNAVLAVFEAVIESEKLRLEGFKARVRAFELSKENWVAKQLSRLGI